MAVQENAQWQAAMRRRGIEDLETVQIDPWPAGSFGVAHEEGRRICRCLFYVRHTPDDNGYAHPIEGVVAFVDMARGEVLEVIDTGVVPVPTECGNYYPESVALRQDLKPIEITQPEGPSFSVDGNHVRWQKWSLRVSMDSVEGLVLHEVGYEDGGRVRPILFRASVSEMVVPYGDPGPMHGWKNAFDAGEWGLGRMANSLTLGCDCLGVIHYFDAVFTSERGHPYVVPNAICMHEEDYGILWKHNDPRSGRNEVRRSRRLVVSSIATVGNYDYGFFWYFYLDGTIQFEVKLTGILSTMAVAPGEQPRFASMVAPQLAAPFHQHLFNVRLDAEVDGPANSVYEVDTHPVPPGPDNPWSNAFAPVATLLETETAAPGESSTRRPAGTGRSSTRARRTAWASPSPTSSCPGRHPHCWPTRTRAWPSEPASPRAICGSRPTPPTSAEPPATTPTSTPAATACPDGPAPTAPSSTRDIVALVHLRRHPRPPTRGLAGDAGRVRRVHAGARGLLRPQPGARRAPAPGRSLPHRVEAIRRSHRPRRRPPPPRRRADHGRALAPRSDCRPMSPRRRRRQWRWRAARTMSTGSTRTWPLWGHTPTTRHGADLRVAAQCGHQARGSRARPANPPGTAPSRPPAAQVAAPRATRTSARPFSASGVPPGHCHQSSRPPMTGLGTALPVDGGEQLRGPRDGFGDTPRPGRRWAVRDTTAPTTVP